MNTLLLLSVGLILGACAGTFLTAVVMTGRFAPPPEPLHNDSDTALLDFLEQSECNLYFHPQVGAWGLLDGKDKMVATALTVRSTLARAMEKDAAELNELAP